MRETCLRTDCIHCEERRCSFTGIKHVGHRKSKNSCFSSEKREVVPYSKKYVLVWDGNHIPDCPKYEKKTD